MKIKYHQQHNNRRKFSQFILIIAIFGIIFISLSISGQLQYITKYLYASALNAADNIVNKTSYLHKILTPKTTLLKENQELQTKIKELKTVSQYNKALLVENNHLKALLTTPIGASNKSLTYPNNNTDSLARIIDYKNTLYGTILTKLESGNKPQIGDLAHFGKLAIGTIEDINGNFILIKLITASSNKEDILIGNNKTIFYGDSNNTGYATLSRKIKIQVGDIVSVPKFKGFILGSVVKIEHDVEESIQTIRIRAPIKISELQFISITHEK